MANSPFPSSEGNGLPSLDEILQHAKSLILIPIIMAIGFGGFSSFYTVQPEEEAVVKRFGNVIDIKPPGFHFKIPFGIDSVQVVPTARVLKEEFGFRSVNTGGRTQYVKTREHRGESLMLTGDLKVIDVEWVVQFQIADASKFLHESRNPIQTIRDNSEAVMRRIVGNSLGSDVLTEKRVQVATLARIELQELLNSFNIGVQINTIELQDVTPPETVKPAFNEVNQAEQERERLINEAEKRRNQVIPRAEGQALQIIAGAEAYRAERVNRSRGEAGRFTAILSEYQNAPAITRQRMYIEMIDQVLPNAGPVYIMEDGVSSPIPLLNLGQSGTSLPIGGGK
ncbi:MAG: FtsH protease activity modulator HflK [Opitutaceae bacterium]|nr:FtsH protease activity modulator HflK [Opitutaceae bacterium]|tara:strand:- start:140 stop:1159 length:1020 start_codon:yes stop_codon:yes gene_type:complete